MDIGNLVQMANRIGEFYESLPDAEEGQREIATHLRKFWEPRMRRLIMQHVEQTGGAGLTAIVHDALVRHRDLVMQGVPTTIMSPE